MRVIAEASNGKATVKPGPIAIFGSGEAASSSRKVHDRLLTQLTDPVHVAIIETPAGFQPNVDVVTAKIREYLTHHLQNFKPEVSTVSARRVGSAYDPNDPATAAPLESANYIVAGPGSPTYAIRHLRDTTTWRTLTRRHAEGATLALASASAIALGAYALPVYEIFKVGDDLTWVPGLNLFGLYGMELAIIPHWNNHEGGKDLDTSRCFMGVERFETLRTLLPPSTTIIGIDEHTSCVIDLARGQCDVMGVGSVSVLVAGGDVVYPTGASFSVSELQPSHVLARP